MKFITEKVIDPRTFEVNGLDTSPELMWSGLQIYANAGSLSTLRGQVYFIYPQL